LGAFGTSFQVAVFLKRSCGIDHHFIGLEFEHSITLIFYAALSGLIALQCNVQAEKNSIEWEIRPVFRKRLI
jgi:hypothetical protein